MTPEEAEAAAQAYQQKVLAHLLGLLTFTGNTPATTSTSTTNTSTNEEETPRSRLN